MTTRSNVASLPGHSRSSRDKLRLLSVNVQGIRSRDKRDKLFRDMAAPCGPYGMTEIFLLQETHCKTAADLDEWGEQFKAYASDDSSFILFSLAPQGDAGAGVALDRKSVV